jgi:DNA-binding transcriptional MerR regulator
MWISDFSRKAGLSRETVRFYVRLGLLHPKKAAGRRETTLICGRKKSAELIQ